MKRLVATIVLASASSAALGAEIVETRFQVDVTRDGLTTSSSELLVPYLPDQACYNWFAKFDAATTLEVTLIETLTLPEPLAAWKDYVNDPAEPTQINSDAQGAVTTLKATPDSEGWVSHGWCVAEGDPLGAHNITVTFEGAEVASWDFTVVAAEDYQVAPATEPAPAESTPPPPPVPQPSPTARDVNQSW
ncbi:MAG TPA: hypothetical protein VIN06_02085 [Devosia sp.]